MILKGGVPHLPNSTAAIVTQSHLLGRILSYSAAMDQDDNRPVPPAAEKTIFFGSLDIQERARLEQAKAKAEEPGPGGTSEGGGAKLVFDASNGPPPGDEEDEEMDGGDEGENGGHDGEDDEEAGGEEGGEEGGRGSSRSAAAAERYDLPESSLAAKAKQEALIRELQLKRRAKALAVPTNDREVRLRLRAMEQPITLFGEREMERRDRLRALMAEWEAEGEGGLARLMELVEKERRERGEEGMAEEEAEELVELRKERFFTEGSQALLQARRDIAGYSLFRAGQRLARAKRKREDPDENEAEEGRQAVRAAGRMEIMCSEFGDDRPLAGCAFAPHGLPGGRREQGGGAGGRKREERALLLATGGWSGACRLWSVPEMRVVAVLKGHTERVTDVAFHPLSLSPSLSPSSANLASASADRCALLWALPPGLAARNDGEQDSQTSVWQGGVKEEGRGEAGDAGGMDMDGPVVTTSNVSAMEAEASLPASSSLAPIGRLKGHVDRLARLAFHPSGRYLATASFDTTWRLWDVERCQELLLQEGHSRAVYTVACHPDGSLVASAGLDALCRVWDTRTGRSLLALEGHVKPVLACDFSPNGHHLVTAGEDHTARVWDLRKKKHCLYVIPAHTSLVSQVKYEPVSGDFLATSSFDGTAKLWSGRDFKPVKVLAGHEGKVMSVGVSSGGEHTVTVGYDRTIKLWGSSFGDEPNEQPKLLNGFDHDE